MTRNSVDCSRTYEAPAQFEYIFAESEVFLTSSQLPDYDENDIYNEGL
ncbi:MAG: hypothetical protein J5764_06340 [Bacteroidales bacterium]|nr:hypothetical protein [Bacteroidales bacterium]